MKPLIGLTPTPEIVNQDHGVFRLNTLNEHYSRAIEAAGGIPVMLPAHFDDVDAMLDRLDGIIVTGGGDIDPQRYYRAPHATTGEIDADRDRFELAITRGAILRDLPFLGICRGMQILNVALGGTMLQDIDTELKTAIEHRQQKDGVAFDEPTHTVRLKEGDHLLRHIVRANDVMTNTFHHQALDDVAPTLQVIATTEDGVVEAVEHPDSAFCMAVQWHPELLAHKFPEHAAIFQTLIDVAQTYQAKRSPQEATESV